MERQSQEATTITSLHLSSPFVGVPLLKRFRRRKFPTTAKNNITITSPQSPNTCIHGSACRGQQTPDCINTACINMLARTVRNTSAVYSSVVFAVYDRYTVLAIDQQNHAIFPLHSERRNVHHQ